jgi:hypothetical protein
MLWTVLLSRHSGHPYNLPPDYLNMATPTTIWVDLHPTLDLLDIDPDRFWPM